MTQAMNTMGERLTLPPERLSPPDWRPSKTSRCPSCDARIEYDHAYPSGDPIDAKQCDCGEVFCLDCLEDGYCAPCRAENEDCK